MCAKRKEKPVVNAFISENPNDSAAVRMLREEDNQDSRYSTRDYMPRPKDVPVHKPVETVESGIDTKSGKPKIRSSCAEQVYAEMEVAENMVKKLMERGIKAKAELCSVCGLIHIRETRVKP